MNEHLSPGKYDHRLLHPNLDFSFPIGQADEEIYQVDQSILQLSTRGEKPELYDALLDTDPDTLLSLFGLKFKADSKTIEPGSVGRIKSAYRGENLIVPFGQKDLLFPVAEFKNAENSLQFAASAWVANATPDQTGKIGMVQLQRIAPYYLLYLVRPNIREKSFTSYVQKQFQFIQAEPRESVDGMQFAYDITAQLFTVVRGYQSPSNVALFQS